MAQCPSCHTPLDEDFGLLTCPGCGANCWVDLEGNVVLQADQPIDEIPSLATEETGESDVVVDSNGSEFLEEPSLDDYADEVNAIEPDFSDFNDADVEETLDDLDSEALSSEFEDAENSFVPDFSDSAMASLSEEDEEEDEEEVGDHALEAMSDTEVANASGSKAPAAMSVTDFLSEIDLFGNIDAEPLQEAAYFFDITISGIDSLEMRNEVLETLDDTKLGLNREELSVKIRNGQLHLFQLSAIKAAIVVQRLSHLRCELDWQMKEVQDLESENMNEVGFDDSEVVADQDDNGFESYDSEESSDF